MDLFTGLQVPELKTNVAQKQYQVVFGKKSGFNVDNLSQKLEQEINYNPSNSGQKTTEKAEEA